MTDEPISKRERSNITIFLLFTVASGISSNICSEGYIQAYLAKLGFGTDGMKNYGIVCQIASVAAYMLCANLPSANVKLKKIYAAAVLCMGIFPAVLAAAGHMRSSAMLYAAVLGAAALHSFLAAFKAVAEFDMTPHLFSRSLYGTALSKAMVIGGAMTVGITVCSGAYENLFPAAPTALLICAILAMFYKFDGRQSPETAKHISYFEAIAKSVSAHYRKKLFPHFLRGIAVAGIYYIVPSALGNISLSDSERSLLIVVSVISMITGSFVFMRLHARINPGAITLAAVIVCAAMMPLLVVCAAKHLFFVMYFIFFTANIISQISIPTGVMHSSANDELPLISAMRLLLTSAATSIFIFLFGVLLKYVNPVYIMLFSGAVFVFCGFLFAKLFTKS